MSESIHAAKLEDALTKLEHHGIIIINLAPSVMKELPEFTKAQVLTFLIYNYEKFLEKEKSDEH